MRICYAIVEDRGPGGQDVWVVQEPHRMFVLVHRPVAADVDHMMRLISLTVTEHAQREWLHVGDLQATTA